MTVSIRSPAAGILGLLLPTVLSPLPASAQRTDVYLFDLEDGGALVARVTDREGYDNRPAFGLDGRSLFFTSDREGGQMDIFLWEMDGGAVTNLTATPEWNEFSGRPWTADGDQFSFVLQEGSPYQSVRRRVEEAGAQVGPADGEGLFVTGDAARSIHPIPGADLFSFVHRQANGTPVLKSLDPRTGATVPLAPAPAGNEEHCWAPDGRLLAGRGTRLPGFRPGTDTGWRLVAELSGPGRAALSRCAVSPDGRYVASVNTSAG